MPELPEVETVARGLARRIVGATVQAVRLHRTDVLHGNGGPVERLAGCRIDDGRRRGKQVRIVWRDGRGDRDTISMIVHLGMTGRLVVVDRDAVLEPHTHLQLALSPRRPRTNTSHELRFCDARRFGGIWLVLGDAETRRRGDAGTGSSRRVAASPTLRVAHSPRRPPSASPPQKAGR
ncbi:MAG: hypothetical protein HY718_00910, partial [Planctomycetes bacterium]|nr:hypothetical protein [Planctomycetota bacterium]